MKTFIQKMILLALLCGAHNGFSAAITSVQHPAARVMISAKRALAKELANTEYSTPIYQFLALTLKDNTTVFARCNYFTGVGRVLKNWRYEKIGELEPRPRSSYYCALIADGDNSWLLMRIDRITGKTWKLDGNVWQLLPED